MNHPILGKILSNNEIASLSPNSSRDDQVRKINEMVTRFNAMLKQIALYDEEDKRIVIGLHEDGFVGIRVGPEGSDVTEVADADLLAKLP